MATRPSDRGYGSPSRQRGVPGGGARQQRQGPHAGRGSRSYQRSRESILEEACERLTRHGEVNAREIQVEVDEGEITLTGTVSSRHEKRLAEDVLESISGVKDVHNQLRIDRGRSEGGNGQDRVSAGPGTTGTPSDSVHGGAAGLGHSATAAAGAGSVGIAPNEASSEGTRALTGDSDKDNDTPAPGGIEDYVRAPRARGKGRK